MAEVFDTTPDNVLMYIRNVLSSEEPGPEGNYQGFLSSSIGGQETVQAPHQALWLTCSATCSNSAA